MHIWDPKVSTPSGPLGKGVREWETVGCSGIFPLLCSLPS